MDIFSYLLGKLTGGGSGKGLKVQIVQELPESGEANILYLVPRQVTKTRNVFDEYLWVNSAWEMIGTTDIDISGKQDKMQFATMPTASADNVGQIVQYTGTTNQNYTNGYFYICVSDNSSYSWSNLNVQESAGGEVHYLGSSSDYSSSNRLDITNLAYGLYTIHYDSFLYCQATINGTTYQFTLSPTSGDTPSNGITYLEIIHPITDNYASNTYIGTFNYLTVDEYYSKIRTYKLSILYNGSGVNSSSGTASVINAVNTDRTQTISGKKTFSTLPESSVVPTSNDQFVNKKYVDDNASQVSTMPTASADYVGKIVQFVGTTTNDYTNGYFYIGKTDGESTPTYSWENINVQASGGGGSQNYIFNYSDSDTDIKSVLQNAYDKYKTTGIMPTIICNWEASGGISGNLQFIANAVLIKKAYGPERVVGLGIGFEYCPSVNQYASVSEYRQLHIECNISSDTITYLAKGTVINVKFPKTSGVLTKDNTTSYTPTDDYNPATKKYVDDKLSSYTGYDATKTQVLKNVQGVLTWVDE